MFKCWPTIEHSWRLGACLRKSDRIWAPLADQLSHRVRYTAAAIDKAEGDHGPADEREKAHTGAALAASHKPPARITHSRTVPARTGVSTLPEPWEAK